MFDFLQDQGFQPGLLGEKFSGQMLKPANSGLA
jgi:hypothetical protein